MYIYHAKLSNGASFTHAIAGNFSGIRNNAEIVVCRNRFLELYVVSSDGRVQIHCSEYLHFVIRAMDIMKYRDRDYILIASDSGQAFVMHYSPERNGFIPNVTREYGMPVILPELPGHFIAASNGGFAVGPLVENYVFCSLSLEEIAKNDTQLNISQPRYVMYDLVGIKQRTPGFASLEVYCKEEENDPDKYVQFLKVYDVNFKTKKVAIHADPLPRHGNKLIYVPQGKKNPHGVIICYEDMITFVPFQFEYPEETCYLPQRKNDAFCSKSGFILTSSTIHEVDGNIVVLAQSEQGDLFSIEVEEGLQEDGDKDIIIKITYIDTIPVASSMCMVEGRLFIAAEFGDNFVYEIKSLGNASEMVPYKGGDTLVTFGPRKLENLSILDQWRSRSPVMQAYVSDFACNNLKQFIFACGRGPSSTLKLQRYGIRVSEMYQVTPPNLSNAVWSVSEEIEGRNISYIVVSLMRATMVLAMDKYLYMDAKNAFKYMVPTIDCAQCTHDSFVQVYHSGFRLIRNKQFTEYKIKKSEILRCALHSMQIALALVNKDGMYFEIEDVNGQVSFKHMQTKFTFKATVMCMAFISRLIKAKHLAVCFENCLEIYSVSLTKMESLTRFHLEHIPESIASVSCEENQREFNTLLNIGYQNGTLQRLAVNNEVVKSEYSVKLGSRPVKLCVGEFSDNISILALSNRAWISFYYRKRILTLAPIDFEDQIDDVAFFATASSPIANIVAMSNKQLYVLSLHHADTLIEDFEVKLTYTPNKFVVNPENRFLIISETDKRAPFHKLDEMTPQKAMDLALSETPPSPPKTGRKPKRLHSVWDSLLHIFDPVERITLFKEPLPINETAVSMRLVRFGKGTPQYLLVGIKQGLMLPGVNPESHVHIYEVADDGKSFKHVNRAIVEDIPYAICPIEGYVLIGVGNSLCLYGFKHSSKSLVRCAAEESQRPVMDIWSNRNFFIVKTSDEHISYGYLDVETCSLVMIHEDRYMRAVTCLCFWDDDIIFVANKKSISAVLLPYHEGCNKPPATDDLTERMEKLSVSEPGPSSKPDEPYPPPGDWLFKMGPSSYQKRACTFKKDSTKVGPSFTVQHSGLKMKPGSGSEAGPSTSKASSSSQGGASTSKASPSSQGGASTSKASPSSQGGASTSKASSSSQGGASTSKASSSSQGGASTSKAVSFQDGASTSKATSSSKARSSSSKTTSSSKARSSSSKAASSSRVRSSSSKAASSSKVGSSSSKAASSHARPSTSKATSSHAKPSTSKAGSSRAGPSVFRFKDLRPPSGSSQVDGDCLYSFVRFMGYSYQLIAHKVGEYVQSIQKASLIEGGRELIVYTTMSGSVGVLVPFLNETHKKFLQPLEYLILKAGPHTSPSWIRPCNPVGKDIYAQCVADQTTIDGNVIDLYISYKSEVQEEIAKTLGVSVQEVLQKIEEMKRTIYV